MLIIGIDPGLSGAMAVLRDHEFAAVYDTPVVAVTRNKSKRREYDLHEMRRVLVGWADGTEPTLVVIESQQAMPAKLHGRAQGTASSFATGLGYGSWRGLIVGVGQSFEAIHPATWKSKMLGVTKGDKGAAILAAKRLFPSAAEHLTRVKDDGRAEAILLAEYARRYVIGHEDLSRVLAPAAAGRGG